MAVKTRNENIKKLNIHNDDHVASCLCCIHNHKRSCEKGHYTEATRKMAHGRGSVCDDFKGKPDEDS